MYLFLHDLISFYVKSLCYIYHGTPPHPREFHFFYFVAKFCLCFYSVKIFLASFRSVSALSSSFLRTFFAYLRCKVFSQNDIFCFYIDERELERELRKITWLNSWTELEVWLLVFYILKTHKNKLLFNIAISYSPLKVTWGFGVSQCCFTVVSSL